MSTYAQDEDVDVNEDVDLEIGSLADQETSDLIDKARKVRFSIKKASIRVSHKDNQDKSSPVNITNLSIQAKIGDDGIDGNGRYAGRIVFQDFILAFSQEGEYAERATNEWWQKSARGPAKVFLAALGFDPAAPPRINKDFLDGLTDREFFADILQKAVEEKTDEINAKGKNVYKKTGEYRNELANYREV